MENSKMIIHGIKVGDQYYITSRKQGYSRTDLKRYYFDGEKAQGSFDDNWVIINKAPLSIIEKTVQPDINKRYCLIDDTLVSENRPLELEIDEACSKSTCGDLIWKEEYAQYKSLYTLVSDKQPLLDVDVEFEWNDIGEVEAFDEPEKISYPTGRVWRSYSSKHENDYVRKGNIQHQEIDKAIFPSFLIHTKPCKISKKDAYGIIREHVKMHIDPKCARVSSDYDFTFTVMKQITLAKPFETISNYKPAGKRKSITRTIMNTVKEQSIFDMKEERGQWLNVPEFEGKDENELKEHIDTYLEQLMAEINKPIKECSYCNGTGVSN